MIRLALVDMMNDDPTKKIDEGTLKLVAEVDAEISILLKQLGALLRRKSALLGSMPGGANITTVKGRIGLALMARARDILLKNGPMAGPDLANALDADLKTFHALASQESKKKNPRILKIDEPGKKNRIFVAG